MTDVRPAPYPSDTLARGWRFEVDMERFKRSDTWKLAKTGTLRAALLLLWAEAWQESPCGTLPNDDELIALTIDMPAATFAKHRSVLMRGWALADDGRLYHDIITERVLSMLDKRASDAQRAAKRRAAAVASGPTHSPITDASRVTHGGFGSEFDTKHQAPSTEEKKDQLSLVSARPAAEAPALTLVGEAVKGPPDCPHQAVLALWAEVLPALPQHLPSQWRGTRADHLRARWRETAVEKGWTNADQGLTYLRKLFGYVGQSDFLSGRTPPRGNARPFVIELEWLVNPTNWAKVHEGKYHGAAA